MILLYILAVVFLSYRAASLTVFAKMVAIVLAGLFVFRSIARGEKIFFPIEYRLLLGWFLVGVISSALADDPAATVPRILTLIQVFPVAFMISNFIYWNGDTRFYWLCLVGATVASGLLNLVSPAAFTGEDGRIFGTLGNANAFAALLAAAIALCAASLMSGRSLVVRITSLALAAFFLFLVARTGSRMGMLASLAGVIAVSICYQATGRGKGIFRYLAFLIFGVVIVGATIYFLTSSEFADRLQALAMVAEHGDIRAGQDTSLFNRLLLYRKALDLMLGSPLLGVGLDVFRTAGIDFRQIGNNSHSNYMEILASTGFIGGLVYFAMYFCWWSRLVKMKSLLRDYQQATYYAIAVALASVVLVLDVAWVTYYEKLAWLVLAGLIAEVHLLTKSGRRMRNAAQSPTSQVR